MPCPMCIELCPKDRETLARRYLNASQFPFVQFAKCPRCGGEDWAFSEERIVETPRKWWQFWRRG